MILNVLGAEVDEVSSHTLATSPEAIQRTWAKAPGEKS